MSKLFVLVWLVMLTASVLMASNSAASSGNQLATITSVHRMEVTEPAYSGGDNPSDAPLESQYYAYNIGVKTDCGTYVAHFESPYDYLPSAFAANREVPVRVSKHTIDFDLGYREVQIRIIRQKTDKEPSCSRLPK